MNPAVHFSLLGITTLPDKPQKQTEVHGKHEKTELDTRAKYRMISQILKSAKVDA